VDEQSSRDETSDTTVDSIIAPASASQVYHAALLSSSTLDNILAAFENDQRQRRVVVDQILVHRKPKT
jgi:hypothetical protein